MRISDWSSDVCSSDLIAGLAPAPEDEPADRHHDETDRGQHADKLVHPAEELPPVPGDPIADNAIYDVPIGQAFARGCATCPHVKGEGPSHGPVTQFRANRTECRSAACRERLCENMETND